MRIGSVGVSVILSPYQSNNISDYKKYNNFCEQIWASCQCRRAVRIRVSTSSIVLVLVVVLVLDFEPLLVRSAQNSVNS